MLLVQMDDVGEHGLVGAAGAAAGLAAAAGRFVTFENAGRGYSRSMPDGAASTVNDPGRIVRALQFAGEELQRDAAAESFVLVDHEGDRDAGGPHLLGEVDSLVELGAVS
nr:hypothetical protein GCM10010200_100110 [Actinomadura rugatobispora]